MQARFFDRLVLIAAEESGAIAGGQAAQGLTGADATRAQLRPTPEGWFQRITLCAMHWHGNPDGESIARTRMSFP
jgi:hypothetical protein